MAGIITSGGFTKAAAEGILKDVYIGPVNRLINQKSVLLGRVQREAEGVSGRQVIVPLHVEANERVITTGRGGKLPDPKSQVYDKATVLTKYYYGRIKIDGPTIADLKDDMGAFLRATESEMQGLAETAASKQNQQLFGKGDGVRALVDGNPLANATDIDLRQPWGFPNYAFSKGTQYLRKGQLVIFVRGSSFITNSTGHEITVVSPALGANGRITIAANTMDLADGDKVVLCSHDAITSGNFTLDSEFNNAILGLGAAIDDTSVYLGVDPAVRPIWKANILGNGGTVRSIEEDLIQQLVDVIETNSMGSGPTAFLTTHGLRRQYAALLRNDRRFPGMTEVDGGFGVKRTVLMFQGGNIEIPIFVDRDCPAGFWWGVDEGQFRFYQKAAWNWMDDDGSILHRLPDDDAFQATLRLYTEFATGARNRHGLLKDLAE